MPALDRYAWPEGETRGRWFESSQAWYVFDIPPEPWPNIDDMTDFPLHEWGPAGTVYVFTQSQIVDRLSPGGESIPEKLLDILKKFGIRLVQGTGYWAVPLSGVIPAVPVEVHGMRWIHATIIGQLDTNETVAHTLNFRTNPAADVDQDAAAIGTFAGQIRDAWMAFLASTPSGSPMRTYLTPALKYTEVRAAYLEQLAPANIGTEISRKTGKPVKTFDYPRPAYLVETQYSLFPTTGNNGSGVGMNLPYEVAMCLSLTTGLRGPRNRGRLYLGGLNQSVMGADGNFASAQAQAIAASFQTNVITRLNTQTGNRVHVVSRSYGTSVGVNGVRVGLVPDSQRRRRKSRLESYGAIIPT